MIRKVPQKSIWVGVPHQQGVPETGFPIGFLIKKGFLKGGSGAIISPSLSILPPTN